MSIHLRPHRRSRRNLYRDGVIPIEAHEGTRKEFLLRHERECSGYDRMSSDEQGKLRSDLLKRTADTRNLLLAVEHTVKKGEKAPGPNGERLWELCRADQQRVNNELKRLSRELNAGSYEPGPTRRIDVPKSSGIGTRPIDVMDWQDLVVQRAIVQIVQPLIDPRLGQLCFGARPNRCRDEAMAHAKVITGEENRPIAIVADLRNAFTRVPLNPVAELVRKHLGATPASRLIETIIRANGRRRGLGQGAPLSSLLLDVFLDAQLDSRWRNLPGNPPMIRWVDDLLILCRTTEEAQEAYARLQTILRPTGMALKGNERDDIVDLTKSRAVWMGVVLAIQGGELAFHAGDALLRRLTRNLTEAIEKSDGVLRCSDVLTGTFHQSGACFTASDRTRVVEQAIASAVEVGADEPPESGELLQAWGGANVRYSLLVNLVRDTYHQRQSAVIAGHGFANGHLNSSGSTSGTSGPSVVTGRQAGQSRPPQVTLRMTVTQQPSGIGCWAVAIVPRAVRRPVTFKSRLERVLNPESLWRIALREGLSRAPVGSVVHLSGMPPHLVRHLLATLRPPTRPEVSPSGPSSGRWYSVLKVIRERNLSIVDGVEGNGGSVAGG